MVRRALQSRPRAAERRLLRERAARGTQGHVIARHPAQPLPRVTRKIESALNSLTDLVEEDSMHNNKSVALQVYSYLC